jgi:hypothetical protein
MLNDDVIVKFKKPYDREDLTPWGLAMTAMGFIPGGSATAVAD